MRGAKMGRLSPPVAIGICMEVSELMDVILQMGTSLSVHIAFLINHTGISANRPGRR